MTFESLLEYGGWIVVLYIASFAALTKVWKPVVLHQIRNFLRTPQLLDDNGKPITYIWKRVWFEDLYAFLCQAGLFVSGMIAAGPMKYELDLFSRWPDSAPSFEVMFGLQYSPWFGTAISCLLMVLIGEQLHDYFSENDISLPMMRKKPNG